MSSIKVGGGALDGKSKTLDEKFIASYNRAKEVLAEDSSKASLKNKIVDAYKALFSSNSIGGVKLFDDSSVKEMAFGSNALKKLAQDELRLYAARALLSELEMDVFLDLAKSILRLDVPYFTQLDTKSTANAAYYSMAYMFCRSSYCLYLPTWLSNAPNARGDVPFTLALDIFGSDIKSVIDFVGPVKAKISGLTTGVSSLNVPASPESQ